MLFILYNGRIFIIIKSWNAKLKNCEAGGDFYLRLGLNGMKAGSKAVRSEPLLCEHSNCTGVGNELCVRLIVPMNSLELTWCWIGIAIGLSIGVVVVPFTNFGNYTVRWIIVGYLDTFCWILQMMALLTVRSAFENIVDSDKFTYKMFPGREKYFSTKY